jgi:hypothetical protein
MPVNFTIPEILIDIKTKAKNPEDMIRGLHQNNTVAIKELLRYAFDGQTWYRKTLPNFTEDGSPDGLAPSSLWSETKRLYIFKEEYNLSPKRKDEILIQILESISKKEIDMIRSMFDGSFKYSYGIDKEMVEKAYPNLFRPQTLSR